MSYDKRSHKSPLFLLIAISILIICTLVVASAYFIQPNIEKHRENKRHTSFSSFGLKKEIIKLSGDDVILSGMGESNLQTTLAGTTLHNLYGPPTISDDLLVKNRTNG